MRVNLSNKKRRDVPGGEIGGSWRNDGGGWDGQGRNEVGSADIRLGNRGLPNHLDAHKRQSRSKWMREKRCNTATSSCVLLAFAGMGSRVEG